MKLLSATTIFNMGDTSFRRKTLLDDYKELLPILEEHKKLHPQWRKNEEAQGIFYEAVMNKTTLFNRSSKDDPKKRGRTLTNALIKPGLINPNRDLSEVALNWIKGNSKSADTLERWLALSVDNIVFLRQWFKLRVYDAKGEKYFYPFRVALEFLSKYDNVPENDLLIILHSIDPKMEEDKIRALINDYENVALNKKLFEEFVEDHLSVSQSLPKKEFEKATQLFSSQNIDAKSFVEVFQNRKSQKAQDLYYDFYMAVKEYKANRTESTLENLISLSKDLKIKKAFGFNKIPFKIPNKIRFSVQEFEEMNTGNLLLTDDMNFYKQFMNSKRSDLIREYADMTKRSFNLSGVFSFENGLVNLVHPWLFKYLFSKYRQKLPAVGQEPFADYELNIESEFYKELTLINIIKLTNHDLDKMEKDIRAEYGISAFESLKDMAEKEKAKKFNKVIEKEFNKEKTIRLLKLFSERSKKNDKKIKELVTDSATVPTIFEYVLGIAWYHISSGGFSILESLNLSLDGDLKPLTHASGGDGDIIIKQSNVTLMLEATLMDKNAQKRGELEPVIRHTANLAIRENTKVMTIFVADQLDSNVINIFRSMSYVQLESTQERNKVVDGVLIFALSINEISQLIQKNIQHHKILSEIEKAYNTDFEKIKIGWREKIINNILAG